MQTSRLIGAAFSCAIVLSPLQSVADDKYWVCSSDSWDQSSCWNSAGQPVTNDSAFLTQSDSTDRVVTYANAISPTPLLNSLTVDATGSGTMELSLGQDLSALDEYIGYDGIGTVTQTGGTNSLGIQNINSNIPGNMYLGYNNSATGTYNLSDGALTGGIPSKLYVGYDGTGVFNQYGGTVTSGSFLSAYIGHNANSTGTYNLIDGSANFDYLYVGTDGTGTINQYGGGLYGTEASIGTNGTYNQYDGQAGWESTYLNGTYNQFNGRVDGVIHLSSGGEYNLIAGGFYDGGGPYNSILIDGTFNQSGGTSGFILPMDLTGTYNLTGGALDAGSIVLGADGNFNFDGGVLSVREFNGDLANNGGTLAPAEFLNNTYHTRPIGTTTITGNYSQSIDSVYAVEIGGTGSGEFDVLDVAGVATLGGRLDVALIDLGDGEFNPSLGDSFDILLAETISGEFDSYMLPMLDEGLGWDVSYLVDEIDSTDIVRLSVEAVPVPPSVWLFGSGLLGLIGIARRKKAA